MDDRMNVNENEFNFEVVFEHYIQYTHIYIYTYKGV